MQLEPTELGACSSGPAARSSQDESGDAEIGHAHPMPEETRKDRAKVTRDQGNETADRMSAQSATTQMMLTQRDRREALRTRRVTMSVIQTHPQSRPTCLMACDDTT